MLESEVPEQGFGRRRRLFGDRLRIGVEDPERLAHDIGDASELTDRRGEQPGPLVAVVGVLPQLALDAVRCRLGDARSGNGRLHLGQPEQVVELGDELAGGIRHQFDSPYRLRTSTL